ncbi:hypothetical protein [uncultured Muribaculum sp.]|uniref:hypothetical protein n=1 Tax=uncultured Muribaculum sp. TaxID=1918613 RepID=UPI0025DB10C0|nr:hypothetical protein [uncultured Muribaculum sp.]
MNHFTRFLAASTIVLGASLTANAEWNPENWTCRTDGIATSVEDNAIVFDFPATAENAAAKIEFIANKDLTLGAGRSIVVMKVLYSTAYVDYNDCYSQVLRQLKVGNKDGEQIAPYGDTAKPGFTRGHGGNGDTGNVGYYFRDLNGQGGFNFGDTEWILPYTGKYSTNATFDFEGETVYGRAFCSVVIGRKNGTKNGAIDASKTKIVYLDFVTAEELGNKIDQTSVKNFIEKKLEEGTTGIDDVLGDAEGVVDVYSLTGIKVRASVEAADALKDLPRGLYIVGGKKVMVK